MDNIKTTIGAFLKSKRISKSLTGKELAMKLNVSQQQISRYERGVCNISIEMVMKYCQVLDISGYELMKELFTSKNDNM